MRCKPQHPTTANLKPRQFPGVGRRLLSAGVIAITVVGSTTACTVLGSHSCPQEFQSAIAKLEPHDDGDLSPLNDARDETGNGACSREVMTTRTGAEVADYYRAHLRAAGWRLAPNANLACPDPTCRCNVHGGSQCHFVASARGDICFELTTITKRKRQATSAERTTLSFWVMDCSAVDRIIWSDNPGAIL